MKKLIFDGRVAIVTGAGHGMGRAHALMLASRGCRVVVNDMGGSSTGDGASEAPAAAVVSEIKRSGGNAVASTEDVVTRARDIVARALHSFGRLDIVINNAGTLNGTTFGETPAEIWQAVSDVHYRGTVEVCRAAWPHLVASGSGKIVNTASSAMLGNVALTSYGAAKAATFGFTRSLAMEGASEGIDVNCILPSAWTRLTEKIDDPRIVETMRAKFQPEHVAAFVAWLVHQDTRINNQAFLVSAGRAARVVMSSYPYIEARDSSPEGWAASSAELMESGELIPLLSTSESLIRELIAANPALEPVFAGVASIDHTPGADTG